MSKIGIYIKSNVLIFKYTRKRNINSEELMNTNVINDGELLFSEEYINSNKKIVSKFIDELYNEYSINEIEIENVALANMIIPLLSNVSFINNLTIRKDDTINFTLVETLINNKNVAKLTCYQAPEFVIQYLDKYNIELILRNEIFFYSNFMVSNDLNQFPKIYYKKNIIINLPINAQDEEDLTIFFKINKHLKTVYLTSFDLQFADKISKLIKKHRKKDIKVYINSYNISDEDVLNIKLLNKKYVKNLKFKLKYSNEYIRENFVQHLSFSILKFSLIFALIMIFSTFSYIFVSNYYSSIQVEEITNDIDKLITKINIEENEDETSDYYSLHNPDVIKELQSINQDTIGWLTVRNTNVDYPVVQHTDNTFYLKNNYYHEKDYSGWVFMDFRNDVENLQHNTIIYAHNRFNSDVMFGTLENTLDEEWYDNNNNHIISFNTLYDEMQFEIFSIYKTNNSNDYLTNNFNSDNHYITFIDLIKNRSIYNFEADVTIEDKILTLSTCYEYTNRLVIHAKLIK